MPLTFRFAGSNEYWHKMTTTAGHVRVHVCIGYQLACSFAPLSTHCREELVKPSIFINHLFTYVDLQKAITICRLSLPPMVLVIIGPWPKRPPSQQLASFCASTSYLDPDRNHSKVPYMPDTRTSSLGIHSQQWAWAMVRPRARRSMLIHVYDVGRPLMGTEFEETLALRTASLCAVKWLLMSYCRFITPECPVIVWKWWKMMGPAGDFLKEYVLSGNVCYGWWSQPGIYDP